VGWKHTVAAELDTLVIEAAARKGCQFCGLMMQTMREAQMFETIRKVEARIAYMIPQSSEYGVAVCGELGYG
jgi:hypothetical protein